MTARPRPPVSIAGIILCACSFCFADSPTIRLGPRAISTLDLSLTYETRHALEMAFDYLMDAQDPNGSWKNDPAITSLVVYSLLLQPSDSHNEQTAEAVKSGLEYVKGFVKPDGGIYHKQYRNYSTAVCLLAFAEAREPKHSRIVTDAREFLIKFQLDEGEGVPKKHPFYGGIGYGGDDRPDLSNTQLALDAIKAAEIYESALKNVPLSSIEPGPHWRKALVFLARTQNIKSLNDMPYAADDGGFIYEPGHYNDDRSRSYGSMTHAGLKSLLLAGVDREDLRVRRAFAWISSHYTLEENPGFGTASLYYYYMTAAKCLAAVGREHITDSKGIRHRWRQELIEKLISLQHEDGYWVNPNGRYWENIKDLATAYSVIAIKSALRDTLTQ